MKKARIVLATLLVAVMGIAVSAFSVKSYDSKAFAKACYEITVTVQTSDLNGLIAAPVASFTNTGNWSLISPTPTGIPSNCDNQTYVCAICFDETASFTLQNALNAIVNYITVTGSVSHNNTYNGVSFYERSTTP
jgi:hypothetical protein